MSDLAKYRDRQMQDPEFRAYARQMQPFSDLAKAVVGARIERNLTQQELSKLTGVAQSDISRLDAHSHCGWYGYAFAGFLRAC